MDIVNFNLKEIEADTTRRAIEFTKGNLQYARELLGVSKATMYRLVRVYNINYNEIRSTNRWERTYKKKNIAIS